MNVIRFFAENWDFILLALAAVAAVVWAVFQGNKSVIMRMLFNLVTEAERAYGSGTGTLKLAQVMDQIYPKLPAVVKTFITEDALIRWIEDALACAKEHWAVNAAIGAYIKEEEADNAASSVQSAQSSSSVTPNT